MKASKNSRRWIKWTSASLVPLVKCFLGPFCLVLNFKRPFLLKNKSISFLRNQTSWQTLLSKRAFHCKNEQMEERQVRFSFSPFFIRSTHPPVRSEPFRVCLCSPPYRRKGRGQGAGIFIIWCREDFPPPNFQASFWRVRENIFWHRSMVRNKLPRQKKSRFPFHGYAQTGP